MVSLLRKLWAALELVWRRPKGFWDYCLCTISMAFKSQRNLGRPVWLTIEPSNICHLKCPVCETGAGIMKRPKGSIQLDHYKHLVDRLAPHTNALMFYFMGEPFLHKNAYEMIRHAKDAGIYVTTCTTAEYLDPEQVVACGIDEVHVQIGGATQETHEIYRVRGDLQRTMDKAREIVRLRGNLSHPRIVLGFILMKHNEHEVDDFHKLAEEVGIDRATVVDPCVRTVEQGNKFLPEDQAYWFYDKEAFEGKGILRPKSIPDNRCNWIYYSTIVTWNGDVVPCCRDTQGTFTMGNVFEEDFGAIWNGKRYRDFRKRIAKQQQGVSICKLCSSYPVPGLRDGKKNEHDITVREVNVDPNSVDEADRKVLFTHSHGGGGKVDVIPR